MSSYRWESESVKDTVNRTRDKCSWKQLIDNVQWAHESNDDDDDHDIIKAKNQRSSTALNGNQSQSYGASPAIWDRTVLSATRHQLTRPALTPAKHAGTRLTCPGGMKDWVYLGVGYIPRWFNNPPTITHSSSSHLIETRPGVEDTTSRPEVQRANRYVTCWQCRMQTMSCYGQLLVNAASARQETYGHTDSRQSAGRQRLSSAVPVLPLASSPADQSSLFQCCSPIRCVRPRANTYRLKFATTDTKYENDKKVKTNKQ